MRKEHKKRGTKKTDWRKERYLDFLSPSKKILFIFFVPPKETGDLVFDPKCPGFKLNLEIIKANILSYMYIHDDYFKKVTSVVLTRFSFALAW